MIMIKIAQSEIIGKWGSKARYGIAKDKYDYLNTYVPDNVVFKDEKNENFKFD